MRILRCYFYRPDVYYLHTLNKIKLSWHFLSDLTTVDWVSGKHPAYKKLHNEEPACQWQAGHIILPPGHECMYTHIAREAKHNASVALRTGGGGISDQIINM